MKRILLVCLMSCLAPASRAGAGDRCDLDGQNGAEVLVRYPLEDPGEHPDDPSTHRNDHIVWRVNTALAVQGPLVGHEDPRVIGVGDFVPGGECDLLWEERDPSAGSPGAIRLLVTEGLVQATASMFGGGTERPPLPWDVAGTFDLTGDGRVDVLWWNPRTGEASLWIGTDDGWAQAPVIGGFPISGAETADPLPVTAIAQLEPGRPPGVVFLLSVDRGMVAQYYRTEWSGTKLRLVAAGTIAGLGGPGLSMAAVGDFDRDDQDDLMVRSVDSTLSVCFMAGLTVRKCEGLTPGEFALPRYDEGWFVVGPR
jgi:hypothetical protein